MKFLFLIFNLVLSAEVTFAKINLQSCADPVADFLKNRIGKVSDEDKFTVKDGKISVVNANKVVTRETSDTKEIYEYLDANDLKVKLEVSKTGELLVMKRIYEASAGYVSSDLESFKIKDKECHLEQLGYGIMQNNQKESVHLQYDGKFCEASLGLMRKYGQQKVDECEGLLNALSAVYLKRIEDLKTESKTLQKLGPVGLPLPLDGVMAAASCMPQNWTGFRLDKNIDTFDSDERAQIEKRKKARSNI